MKISGTFILRSTCPASLSRRSKLTIQSLRLEAIHSGKRSALFARLVEPEFALAWYSEHREAVYPPPHVSHSESMFWFRLDAAIAGFLSHNGLEIGFSPTKSILYHQRYPLCWVRLCIQTYRSIIRIVSWRKIAKGSNTVIRRIADKHRKKKHRRLFL